MRQFRPKIHSNINFIISTRKIFRKKFQNFVFKFNVATKINTNWKNLKIKIQKLLKQVTKGIYILDSYLTIFPFLTIFGSFSSTFNQNEILENKYRTWFGTCRSSRGLKFLISRLKIVHCMLKNLRIFLEIS